jgi:Ca-activated chloride channel family protein
VKFNQALAVVVVAVFSAVCALVLLRRGGSDAGPSASPQPAGTAPAPGVPPAAAKTLTVLLLNSVAKQAFIDRVVADFNAQRLEVAGKQIAIKVEHGTSGDHWNSIKDGRAQPALWSPGDESWIRIANDNWRGVHNQALFDKAEPTVNVPLCIGMWEPMALALGYPKPLGWADLVKISTDAQGWARYGHPEWGAFKWGHAHPDANSGFLTVLAEVYAQTHKTKGLTTADLKSPALLEYVTKLEHSVEHYGLSSVWIENFMREKGPAYLSATVQYENAIIEGNRKTQNKPFKIVAIYPKEGTVLAQHPIAVARGDWMNDELTAGAQKFVDYLLTPETQALAMTFGIRPIRPMPVTEPISPEWGVSAELPPVPSFEVPTEDVLRRLTDLWLAAKKPASVMLLLDTSGSMAGEAMDRAKDGAVAFIEKMQARDELEIRTFSDKIFRLQAAAPIASAGETARQSVRGLFASGGTHLYEVLQQGVVDWSERKKRTPGRHFGIVLMTDGQDEGSPISLADLMDVLPKGDNPETIKIFTIAYGPKAQKNLLKEISNKSNARAFEGSVADIGRIYQELSANF